MLAVGLAVPSNVLLLLGQRFNWWWGLDMTFGNVPRLIQWEGERAQVVCKKSKQLVKLNKSDNGKWGACWLFSQNFYIQTPQMAISKDWEEVRHLMNNMNCHRSSRNFAVETKTLWRNESLFSRNFVFKHLNKDIEGFASNVGLFFLVIMSYTVGRNPGEKCKSMYIFSPKAKFF